MKNQNQLVRGKTLNKSSKGEEKVELLLRKGGINYMKEVYFSDLLGKKGAPLRFDFGIFINKRLISLIEFDGKPHFEYTPYFHKQTSDFLKYRERDRRKNAYCLKHNIPLIRIPYWDLETLTLNKIFNTPSYRVVDKYHNDNLIKNRK